MRFLLSVLASVFLLAQLAAGDLYMMNPRGSNNRLNEPTATRTNNNRLMDTQNNARGGYNVGDKTATAATTPRGYDDPNYIYSYYNQTATGSSDANAMQYPMLYFEGSYLTVEWTNQHGCGGNEATDPHQQNCELILQYMCETVQPPATVTGNQKKWSYIYDIHDGTTTGTPQALSSATSAPSQSNNHTNGRHESEYYYWDCQTRQRNAGLFLADQNLRNKNTAIYTRQNNGGGQSGLECPEERDYYPYWSPSPWRDIAVLTDHVERCPLYQSSSQNVATVYKCEGVTGSNQTPVPITQSACTNAGGTWTPYLNGASATGAAQLSEPVCQQADWSRTNHHGNGRYGEMLNYTWQLPTIASLQSTGVNVNTAAGGYAKCVFRMRYNISTDDYDGWNINATMNDNPAAGVHSPVTGNPTVDVGGPTGLQLAINTAQFGRTFQDRSHIFYIKSRPSAPGLSASTRIINLNVRGKRGNIVETYPAVEYDFIPNNLNVYSGDFIHVQWTGSNTHNNGNPGGDGQAGDAGEGTDGTDRQNIVQTLAGNENYPIPLDKFTDNMWSNSKCYDQHGATIGQSTPSWLDCALLMSTSGYFRTASDTLYGAAFDPLLDTAAPSLIGGVLMQFDSVSEANTYTYMCSRNNNFTNRSQKGQITVNPGSPPTPTSF